MSPGLNKGTLQEMRVSIQPMPQEQRKYRSPQQVTEVTALSIAIETFLLVCNKNQQNAHFVH